MTFPGQKASRRAVREECCSGSVVRRGLGGLSQLRRRATAEPSQRSCGFSFVEQKRVSLPLQTEARPGYRFHLEPRRLSALWLPCLVSGLLDELSPWARKSTVGWLGTSHSALFLAPTIHYAIHDAWIEIRR